MKPKLFILWLVVLLSLAAPMGGMAASMAATLWDNLIPHGEKKVGNIPVEYNQYPLSHYQLDLYLEEKSFWDLDEKLSDTGHYFLHQLTNMLWQDNVEFSRMVIWVLEEALKLDLVVEIGQSVGEGVQTLAGFDGNLTDRGFYGLFFPLMIVILGGWVGWKALAEGNEDAAVRGLIHAFVVIFFAFTFFYFAKDFTTEANRVSGEISKGVMALASNTFQPGESLSGEEATTQAGNNLWDLMVRTPYKLLQFGTTDVDQKRVDALLSQSPENKGQALQNEIQRYENSMITPKSSGTRLGFVLMVLVLNLVVSLIILLVAAGMPFYQLYFLFLLMLAPIAFTWAIVPAWRDALEKWISEVLGALLMKVALGMLLAIYLSISGALYQFSIEKGYFLSMLLQLVLLGLVIWKRKNIYQLVTMPATMSTGYMKQPGNLLDTMHKVFGIFDVVRGRRGGKPEPQRSKKKPKRAGEPSTSSAASEYIPTYIAQEVPKEEKPDLIFEPYDDPALQHEDKPALEEMPMLVFDEPSEPEPLPELEPAPSVREEKKPDREEAPILLVGETKDD